MPNDERIIAEEIRRMGEFITKARGEVSAIITAKDSAGAEKNINHIAIELEEVVRHTEEATNTIMDHAEALQKISSTDAAVANHAMAIMEACSFQDITGQRVKKVLQIIEQVEMRIDNLVDLLGGNIDASSVETLKTGKERADEHLMAGPQLKGEGVSQADVDKLFE